MNKLRNWWLAGAGVVALVAVIGAGVVMAQSPTPSTQPNASGTPAANGGTPQSNEDPTHEAKEDPTREANENSGNFRGHGDKGGHMRGAGPNEDPTHEANEDPTREANENSGNFGHNAPKGSATATP